MQHFTKVTYAILVKHFISFYTQIRYALGGVFHMWKPTFSVNIQPVFTQRFHPRPPSLSSADD
jgi:hypothetical protein